MRATTRVTEGLRMDGCCCRILVKWRGWYSMMGFNYDVNLTVMYKNYKARALLRAMYLSKHSFCCPSHDRFSYLTSTAPSGRYGTPAALGEETGHLSSPRRGGEAPRQPPVQACSSEVCTTATLQVYTARPLPGNYLNLGESGSNL